MDYRIKKMSTLFLVADIDRSIEFYTKKLGFDFDLKYEDFYAGIIRDGYSIHLKSGKTSIEERTTKKNNLDPDILFSIDNIEDVFADLSKNQIEIVQPLRAMPYGKEFYISDPDGNIIAFLGEA